MRWNMGGTSGATILCVIWARSGLCGVRASVTLRQPSRVGRMFPEEENVLSLVLVGAAPAKRKRGRVRAVVAAPGRKVRTAVGESGVGESGGGIHGMERVRAVLVNKNTRGRGGKSTRGVRHGSVDGRAFMKTTRGGNSLSCDRRGFGMRRSRRVGYGKKECTIKSWACDWCLGRGGRVDLVVVRTGETEVEGGGGDGGGGWRLGRGGGGRWREVVVTVRVVTGQPECW